MVSLTTSITSKSWYAQPNCSAILKHLRFLLMTKSWELFMLLWFVAYIHNWRKCSSSVRGEGKRGRHFHPTQMYEALTSIHRSPGGVHGLQVNRVVLTPGEFQSLFTKDEPRPWDVILPWLIPVNLEVMTHHSCFEPQPNQYSEEAPALVFSPDTFALQRDRNSSKECTFKRKQS